MLTVFRKKSPPLKELIPNDFTDIHSHILWGLDDGPITEVQSKLLVKHMKELGFARCITTPHCMTQVWENTLANIQLKEAEVINNMKLWEHQLPLKAAAEYLLDGNFRTKLEQEKLLTLKDNIVLVELSYSNPPIQLYDILFALQLKGYTPLLAHPERYVYYATCIEEFKQLKHAGCLFQLNLLATTGYYGKEVLQLVDVLLKNGMYDFVGSDIHNLHHCNNFQNKVVVKNISALEEVIQKNSFFTW